MAIVVKETSRGSNLRWGDNGWEDTLVFTVTGLSGSTSFKRYIAALSPGIPQRGQNHPYIPGIVARSCPGIEMPGGHEFARVTINYAVPEEGDGGGGGGGEVPIGGGISVRLGTIYERVSSNYAVNADGTRGEVVKVWWNSTVTAEQGEGSMGSIPTTLNDQNFQTGTVGNFIARPTLIFRGKSDKLPLSKSTKVGFTNSDDFLSKLSERFDDVPDAMQQDDTWMLIRQEANSKDGGQTIDVEREVAFRHDKWYEVATFINPATGRPPANLATPAALNPGIAGNGFKVVRVAGQASFIDLLEF